MKKMLAILIVFTMIFSSFGCAGWDNIKKEDVANFAIETLAMWIGYKMQESFTWTEDAQGYYMAIQQGSLDLIAAQKAQKYLFNNTHPMIADRMIRLGTMVGFTLNGMTGEVIGIDEVDIGLLQVAAEGFKMGLYLDEEPNAN